MNDHEVTVSYTNDDDGIHLYCQTCGAEKPLGFHPTVPEVTKEAASMKHSVPRDQLQVRHVYVVHSRNLLIGVWNGEGFTGIREKFDDRYLATEFLNDPPGSGTAWATGITTGIVPDEISLRETLGTECFVCSKPVEFIKHNDPTQLGTGNWFHTDCSALHKVHPISVPNTALYDFLVPFDQAEGRS